MLYSNPLLNIINRGDFLNCCITDMREKEVINLCDGHRLGSVSDVEIDTCTGCVISIIIWGKSKCGGLLGKTEDIKIPWSCIKIIGDETILVNYDCPVPCACNGGSILDNLFHHS